MSDQKRKKQSLSIRLPTNAQIKSTSSSSALSHVDDASENCSESSRTKNRFSGRSSKRNCSNADSIRRIIREEGRVARNLVTWNVPLENAGKNLTSKVSGASSPVKKSFPSQPHSSVGQQKVKEVDQVKTYSRKVIESQKCQNSTSTQKIQQSAPRRKDIRARYWAYLFENLHRAVDEIYQTCEGDESVVECKEVIMMLDQYRQDFNSLIERLQLMQEYEKGGDSSRKINLAWEVRKRSPSKSLMIYKKETFSPTSSKVTRSLFTSSTDSAVELDSSQTEVIGSEVAEPEVAQQGVLSIRLPSDVSASSTWADRVRSLTNPASNKERILKATKPSNQPLTMVVDQQSKDKAVVKKADHPKLDVANVTNKNPNVKSGSANNNSGVNMNNNQTPYSNLINLVDPQGPDIDLEGWETVSRGGKQRQRTLPLASDPSKGRHPSFSSKSLHSIPSSADPVVVTSELQVDVHLSSSSPILFSPQPPQVILGLPSSAEREDRVGGVDALVAQSTDNSFEDLGGVHGRIFTGCDAEPNLDVIFAKCCQSSNRAGAKDAVSSEIDDEELNNALMDVLKEEDNLEMLDVEGEAALESAMLEEKTYLREIEREEMEGDAEEEDDDERRIGDLEGDSAEDTWCWDYIMKKYEEDKAARKEESWGDAMEETEARTPGRLVHIFEKLSSPSRKRATIESRQRLDEKLEKAAELREKSLSVRGENLRMLRKKVEDIQSLKNELMNQARLRMEKRLQRAEKKRQILLQMKVRKAHEEDTKANEIAFINTLEAQNKRHEIMAKHQESEARLQDMQEERQRKHEEKAAKEAAAEERRKALEAERVSRLQEMQDRRRQRETDFEQRQQEKEKERVEAARARDREREERLAALNKQQQAHIEELQKKIQQKQDETDRRHKEKLEAIQEKAFRMSLQHHSNEDNNDVPPMLAPYEKKKFCSVCNVLIPSEVYLLSHLRGKMHQKAICDSSQGIQPSRQDIEKFNLQHISDAPSDRLDPNAACERERLRAFKKRCKKLKLRMVQRSNEYEASLANKSQDLNSQHKNKLQKVVKDLQKCMSTTSSGPWAQNRVSGLDRCLGEISRIFEKNVPADKVTFKSLGGVTILFQILDFVSRPHPDIPPLVPNKSLLLLTSVLKMLCLECPEVCRYLLLSNKICMLIDLVSQHLNVLIPDDFSVQQNGPQCKLLYDQFVSSLVELLAAILFSFTGQTKLRASTMVSQSGEGKKEGAEPCTSQAFDVVSYIVSIGILDKISVYFNNIRGSVDGEKAGAEFLQNCLILVTSLIGISSPNESLVLESKKLDDPTQLVLTLKVTQLVGIVSLMYGILLHSDAPARGNNPPPCLPRHTLDVAFLGFRMLNEVACLNLSMFQSSLGEEGTSLEFRHIASYLLWYCNCCSDNELLLHEVVLCVGYFGLLHADNQIIIQSGQPPTILQQLCLLPFQYFSNPKLTGILFPTLVCCCFRMPSNRSILEQELSCILLSNFLEENLLRDQSSSCSNQGGEGGGGEESSSLWSVPSSFHKFRHFHGPQINRRMQLAARFPKHLWHEAQTYFSNECVFRRKSLNFVNCWKLNYN